MRILHVINHFGINSGAARLVASLIPCQIELGSQVDLISLSGESLSYVEAVEKIGCHCHTLLGKCDDPKRKPQMIFKLIPFMKSYDIVHVHLFPSLYRVAIAKMLARAIMGLGIRHIAWEHFNQYAGSKTGFLYKMLVSWFVDATVVLTKADARDYRTAHSPRIYEIPNFTFIGKYEPSKCEGKILLAVGCHAPQKGFDLLIRAWARTKVNGWKLRIVGSGDDKLTNMKLADELGVMARIEFAEAPPDIAHEFQSASCFVLSSRFEGLGLVLIEAKMMGLSCVSFDCPNGPQEVIRDGVDGILVPAEDIEALSQSITRMLQNQDKLKEMGRHAREDVLKRYSPKVIVEQWVRLIESR